MDKSNPVRNHFCKHKYFYFVIGTVFIIYILPFLYAINYFPIGHDGYFHMTRLYGLALELASGHFPARIYSQINRGMGYAVPLFYGDWLLYFPAVLVLMGVSIVAAYKTFVLFCIILASVTMYFSAKLIFKDKQIACLTAIIYSLSTYIATDAFVRSAIGELQCFIFIPIAFAGLYDVILSSGKRWILLPLGMCGMIVSHLLTAVGTVIFFAIFTLLYIDKLIKVPPKCLYLLYSIGLFLLFSASFLFPLIEQLRSATFVGTNGFSAVRYGTLRQHTLQSLGNMFSVHEARVTVDGLAKKQFIPAGVGFSFVAMLVWFGFYLKKLRNRFTFVMLSFAVLALWMTSRFFSWDSLQSICGALQFPWRILFFATFFISMFFGIMTKTLIGEKFRAVIVSLILVLAFSSCVINIAKNYEDVLNNKVIVIDPTEYDISLGVGEYLPSDNGASHFYKHKGVISSDASFSDYNLTKREGGGYILSFNNAHFTKQNYIDFPLVMYKGYRALLLTDDGKVKELTPTYGTDYIVRVYPGDVNRGEIIVWYGGTSVQMISLVVSIISFIGLIAYYGLTFITKVTKGLVSKETPL